MVSSGAFPWLQYLSAAVAASLAFHGFGTCGGMSKGEQQEVQPLVAGCGDGATGIEGLQH